MTADPGRVMADMQAMEGYLQSIVEPAQQRLSDTQRQIERARAALESAEALLNRRLAAIQSAINDCEFRRDMGERVSCRQLYYEKDAIKNLLRSLERQREAFEYKVERYRTAAEFMREAIDKDIPQATDWLRDRQRALQKFDSGSVGISAAGGGRSGGPRSGDGKSGTRRSEEPSVGDLLTLGRAAIATGDPALLSAFESYFKGMGTHSHKYRKARQEYFRSLPDDPNQPRHVRGWFKQELNRLDAVRRANAAGLLPPGGSSRYLRGIPGYDVGHRVAGIDHRENFRLEIPWLNRSRPARVKRLGLPDWLR